MTRIVLGVFLLISSGCATTHTAASKGKLRLHDDDKRMMAEVDAAIPVGTPIQEAQHILEESGFQCEHMEMDPELKEGPVLRCRAQFSRQALLMDNVVFVWLKHDRGLVTNRRVSCVLMGP